MLRPLLPLSLLWLAGCAMNIRIQPQIPQVNSSATRLPGKVAVLILAATKNMSQTDLEPTPCWGISQISAQPYGEVFSETLRGVLGQYFESVAVVDSPSAPSDAKLVLEASLDRTSLKLPCGISPAFFATAHGRLRALGPDGTERWRSSKTSQRNEQRMPMWSMQPYRTIVPETIASLVSAWATELSMTPFARGEGALPAVTSGKTPADGAATAATPSASMTANADPESRQDAGVPAPPPAKVYTPQASWDEQLLP